MAEFCCNCDCHSVGGKCTEDGHSVSEYGYCDKWKGDMKKESRTIDIYTCEISIAKGRDFEGYVFCVGTFPVVCMEPSIDQVRDIKDNIEVICTLVNGWQLSSDYFDIPKEVRKRNLPESEARLVAVKMVEDFIKCLNGE